MSSLWDDSLTTWLPPPLAEYIAANEGKRFSTLVDAVARDLLSIKDADFAAENITLVQETVQWIPHVETYVKTKTKYDPLLVERLYQAIMHLVFACKNDWLTQARWLNCGMSLLRSYRKDLASAGVVLEWRPYWDLFKYQTAALLDCHYDGHIKMTAFMYLHMHCKLARRLFGSDCAGEMWTLLVADLNNPLVPEAVNASVLFATFFPHHAIAVAPQQWPWNEWVQHLLLVWDGMQHNQFWDGIWMAVFSRLAKHDTHAVVDWEHLLRRVSEHATWFFAVPLGGSSANFMHYVGPHAPLANISGQVRSRSASTHSHLAKIIVYTLRPGVSLTPKDPDGLTPLASLKGIANLLDHFFHASNNGSWSKELSTFLDSLSWNLIRRRLPREADVDWIGDQVNVKLDPLKISPFLEVMVDLATPCMHHKSSSLMNASLEVLSNVVYLDPKTVISIVWQRFEEALEASDSVHQLPPVFRALSCCVRPMLIVGLQPTAQDIEVMDEDVTPQEWAAKELGRAMMLLLPALDANDQKKSHAAIGFYLSVFSNCVAVTGLDNPAKEGEQVIELGLYLEDFIVEFLDRIFGMIDALDASGEGLDKAAINEGGNELLVASWLGYYYKFLMIIPQMLVKLPEHLVKIAIKKIANYVSSLHVPQKAADMFNMLASCAAAQPECTVEYILNPVMARVTEDAQAMDGKNPSSSSVTSLCTKISIVHGIASGMGSALPEHALAIIAMADSAVHISAPGIAEITSVVIERVLMNLSSVLTLAGKVEADPTGSAPMGIPGTLNNAVSAWIPQSGEGARKFLWYVPTDENTALARSLAEDIIKKCDVDLKAMIADGSIADSERTSRMKLRVIQCRMSAVTCALEDVLPLLDMNPDVIQDTPFKLAPDTVSICDMPARGWSDSTILEDATRMALTIGKCTDPSNTWSLKLVVRQIKQCNGVSRSANSSGHIGLSVRSRDRSYTEPQVGGLILGLPVSQSTRQPHWAVELRLEQHMAMRITLLAFNWWGTSTRPKLSLGMMHPAMLDSVAALQQLSLHHYRDVRKSAGSALVDNYLHWSPDLVAAVIPGYIAAMALLTDPSCGLPPSALTPSSNYSLPATPEAAAALTEAQGKHMHALIESSGTGESDQLPDAAESAGVCTNDNKHIVLGAYNVILIGVHMLARLTAHDVNMLTSVVMSVLVMQRYTLAEVKRGTNQMISTLGMRLQRTTQLCACQPVPSLTKLLRLLVTKVESNTLHWRSAAMTHILFIYVVPLVHDIELAADIVSVQLKHFAFEDVLLLKDTAALGLQQTLKIATEATTPSDFSEAIAARVRAAFNDPEWAAQLMAALNVLHSQTLRQRMMSSFNTEASPEDSIASFIRASALLQCAREGRLNLGTTPSAPPIEGGDGGASSGLQSHLSQLVECFGRFAPTQLMAALKEQLTTWQGLPPDEDRLEPQMEYVAMELCIGSIVSGAAFAGSPEATPWSTWFSAFLIKSFQSVTLAKAPLWCLALSHAVRSLAQQNTRILTPLAPQYSTPNSEALATTLADFVCHTSTHMTGSTTSDFKYAALLLFSLDMLIQVQAASPRPSTSQSLQRLVTASIPVLKACSAHPLGMVRTCGAMLAPVMLAVVRSPTPLIPAESCDADRTGSLAQQLEQMLTDSLSLAASALTESNHDASNVEEQNARMDTGAETDGIAAVSDDKRLHGWEAAIDFEAQLGTEFATTCQYAAMFGDHAEKMLPWIIDAQALQHPGLQGISMCVRKAMVVSKVVRHQPDKTPAVCDTIVRGCRSDLWLARAAAIHMLQTYWFRYYFSMTVEQRVDLVHVLRSTLLDTKLEIRQVSASTLSGLLKCLPPASSQAVRDEIMADADRLFPKGRRRKGTPVSTPGTEHHACVLGLRALLLSSPYNIHPWMDEVLMAVVRASRLPNPVKTAATTTLGDFRKTHEHADSRPLHERLDTDVWEAIRDCSMHASYFV